MSQFRLRMAVLWTVVILVLCWIPGSMVQELEEESSWFEIPDLDKVIHGGIFVVFAILWAHVSFAPRRFAWIALGGLCLAAVTELVQMLAIIGRDGSLADTVTDVAGVAVGIIAAPLFEPLARFLESRIWRKTGSQPVVVDGPTAAGDGSLTRQFDR